MEEEAEELNQEEENLQVSISGDPLKTEAVRLLFFYFSLLKF